MRRYKPFLDELDLTYTQYITMMVMWEHRKISVKEIGGLLYLDSGTLTPVLKTLEKKDYVTRERSKEDERSLLVTLTKEGEKLKERAVDVPRKVGKCINLSSEDATALYVILHKIMNNME